MGYYLYCVEEALGLKFLNPLRRVVDAFAVWLKREYDVDYMSPLEFLTRGWDLGEWGLEWLWLLIFCSKFVRSVCVRWMYYAINGGKRVSILTFFKLTGYPNSLNFRSYLKLILWSWIVAWTGLAVVYGIAYLIYGHNSKSIAILFIWWIFYVWYPFGGLQRVDEHSLDWMYGWYCLGCWAYDLDWAAVCTKFCDLLTLFAPFMQFNAIRLAFS